MSSSTALPPDTAPAMVITIDRHGVESGNQPIEDARMVVAQALEVDVGVGGALEGYGLTSAATLLLLEPGDAGFRRRGRK
jgi:hypothetical protein